MKNFIQVKKLGEKIVEPNMIEEWNKFCDFLYYELGLRGVSVEVIEDAIYAMRLLKETDMNPIEIIDKVGRNWKSVIYSSVLFNAIEKFSSKGKMFKKQIVESQKSTSYKTLDDILKTKR